MKTQYYIVLYVILLANCVANAHNANEKLLPDTTIVLAEGTHILRGAFSAAISENEDRIVFVDKNMTSIFQYIINSGELLNYYQSHDSLNCIVRKNIGYLKKPSVSSYRFIPNDSVDVFGLNRKMIENDFFDISYTPNGRILVGGFARWFSEDTVNPDNNRLLQNITCFYFFDDSLNLVYGSPFETYRTEWPNATSFLLYKDSGIVTSVQNYDESYPQMTAFSLFGFDGKHKRLLSNLPEDYSKREYGYYLFNNVLSCRVGNKYFWTSQMDYKIRELEADNSFEITGLDTTNKYSWLAYDSLLRLKHEVEDRGSEEKVRLVLNLKATIEKLSNWHDTLIAVSIYRGTNFIQFYCLDGKLKASFQLIPNDRHTIEKVLFAPKTNRVIAITKDDDNYYFSIYNVEIP